MPGAVAISVLVAVSTFAVLSTYSLESGTALSISTPKPQPGLVVPPKTLLFGK